MISILNISASILCGIVVFIATCRGIVSELSLSRDGRLQLSTTQHRIYSASTVVLVLTSAALFLNLGLRVYLELG